MTEYVLEILDGDLAGTVVPLDADRVTLGRRPGNDLVVKDEKCSGQHAEVVREDGGFLLRDLGSTNGTTLDGRRIDEIALTPGDEFVIGRTRIRFRAAAAAAGGAGDAGFDDLQLRRLDAAAMARGGRRRGSLMLVALLVAGLAAAGAFWFRGQGSAGGGGGRQRETPPRAVSGNLLPAGVADFEADEGWNLQAELRGATFEKLIAAGLAHTGAGALRAARLDDAGAEPRWFAMARSDVELRVVPQQPMVLSGFVAASGGGAAVLRVVFASSSDETAPTVVAGTMPAAPESYAEVRLDCAAPPGVDRATVEILALLPTADAEVRVDDVALVAAGDAAPIVLGTENVRRLVGAGTSLRIDGAEEPTLLGLAPVSDDPVVAALERLGLAELSDAGVTVRASLLADRSGFAFAFDGPAGVALEFPLDATSVRVADEAGGFRGVEPDFTETGLRQLLLGSAGGRALLRFPAPTPVRAVVGEDRYRVMLPAGAAFEVVTVFVEAALRARELVQDARRAHDEGRYADSLGIVATLLSEVPHEVDRAREAVQLRNAILARQDDEVEALLRDGAEAAFFAARVGHERVLRGIEAVLTRYGAEHVARLDELRALETRAREAIATIAATEGERHGERLERLAAAFEAAGDRALAERLREYVKRQYGN